MDKKYGGPERRQHKRHPFYHVADCTMRYCRSGTNQFRETNSINISYGGILIACPFRLSIGDVIDIEISYYAEAKIRTVLQSSIRWIEEEIEDETGNKVFYAGVQFDEMSEDQEKILEIFIDEFMDE